MKNQNQMHAIYETDNIEQARLVASNTNNTSVSYYDTAREIPPTLTVVVGGVSYTKYNPEYIQYLRKKHPDISEDEIRKCIEEATAEIISEETEFFGAKKRQFKNF